MNSPRRFSNYTIYKTYATRSQYQLVIDNVEGAAELVAYRLKMAYKLEPQTLMEVATVGIFSRDTRYQ